MAKIFSVFIRKPLLIISILWLIIQINLYFFLGFQLDLEGIKYTIDAKLFADSYTINPIRLFYSLYPVIIGVFLKIGLGLKAVIIFQLLLNAFATFLFYRIGQRLYKSNLIAFITTSLFILLYLIQQWNFYLFTESIFISFTVILYYIIVNFNSKKNIHFIYLSLIFILLSFLRPNGILLIIPLMYFMFSNKSNYFIKSNIFPLISFAILIGLNLVFNQKSFEYHINLTNKHNWIIWGYYDLMIDNFDGSIIDYIKLFVMRFWVYFTNWRPYFSLAHNAAVMAVLIPIYLFSFYGIKNFYNENKQILLFLILLIAVFSGLAIVTFLNWHGRFLAVIIPAFIIISGYGIKRFINLLK